MKVALIEQATNVPAFQEDRAMPDIERRRCARRPITLPGLLRLQTRDNNSGRGAKCIVKDISASGIFVESDFCPRPGSKVEVELILPTDIGPRFAGNVQRLTEYGIGCHFDQEQPWLIELLHLDH
jgi:hypothetical protein